MQSKVGGRLRDAILSCGVERSSLEHIRVAISSRNLFVLTFTATMLCVFGLMLFAISLVIPVGNPYLYAFLVVSGAAILLLRRFVYPENTLRTLVLSYAVMLVTFAYAIVLSFLPSHVDEPAVSFVAFLVIMPLTIIDVAWHMYAIVGTSAIVFLWISFASKPAATAMFDCVNVITFLILGMLLYTIISNECARELYAKRRVQNLQQHLIVSVATVVEARDEDTGGHVKRTGDHVAGIVERIRSMPSYSGIPDTFWADVVRAAPLHDMGKLRVPDTILNKPGRLTNEEFETIKMHPVWGAEIVEHTFDGMGEDAFLKVARNVALYHHERWEGNGYPTGISGPDIPLEARIMAIADVYDALVSARAYKEPFSEEEAKSIIRDEAGSHFDPALVDVFIDYLDEMHESEKQPERAHFSLANLLARRRANARKAKRVVVETNHAPRARIIDTVLAFVGAACTLAGVLALVSLFQVRDETANYRDQYEECVAAANELMDASDYLTTEARSYVMRADTDYMEAYLNEVVNTRSRDNAVAILTKNASGTSAERELESALAQSNLLAQRELYAMRLTAEATGAELPAQIEAVDISEEDELLDDEEKRSLAEQMVFGDEYDEEKNAIIRDVDACASDLSRGLMDMRNASLATEKRLQTIVLSSLVIDALLVLIAGILNYLLVLQPMQRLNRNILDNEMLDVRGSQEIRGLAESYNLLYRENMRRTTLLKHQSQMDSLTGLYNRGSFDHVLSRRTSEIALIMIDVDRFKRINDQYGHEVGDKVLKKIGASIRKQFRTTDYVCRVGGDEFAVILTEIKEEMRDMVSAKLNAIIGDIASTSDGLPGMTMSAGIAFSATLPEGMRLYRAADEALDEAKRRGRNAYVFYGPR